jgi:hypothetical protein
MEVVPARTAISASSAPEVGGKLDLTKAPLRLLAIGNRLDLRNLAAGKAGEGRFVFGVLDGGTPRQFTVILEYNLPGSTQADVASWAARWHALGTLGIGTPAYNAALQKITDAFAGPNLIPTRPNGSSISQVRSNEIALSSPWELREFGLNAAGNLVERTVALTPQAGLNGSTKVRDFVNTNQAAILGGTFVVPLTFGVPPSHSSTDRQQHRLLERARHHQQQRAPEVLPHHLQRLPRLRDTDRLPPDLQSQSGVGCGALRLLAW